MGYNWEIGGCYGKLRGNIQTKCGELYTAARNETYQHPIQIPLRNVHARMSFQCGTTQYPCSADVR